MNDGLWERSIADDRFAPVNPDLVLGSDFCPSSLAYAASAWA